jgi:nitroreductase
MAKRRTVREFSDRPVPRATIEWLVRTAASAPSGANKQPWRFVAVHDPAMKRRIRAAAEKEEREFYAHRANAEWLADLAPLGTDASKPFLEIAPWIVVVFKLTKGEDESQHYYVNESVGIAVGLFLAAAQHAGLATLTHTPSPMGFLQEVLGRPRHEKPYVVIPVGHAADGCRVPAAALRKKPLDDVLTVV